MYKQILREKKKNQKIQIMRLKNGLDKLLAANQATQELQIKLKNMQPELEQASIETEKMMVVLEVEKKEAFETQKIVSAEEFEAQKSKEEATKLANQAMQSVAESNKILEVTL